MTAWNEILLYVRSHDSGWLLSAALMTMFTVHTALRLAEETAAESGDERRVWLLGSGVIAGLARFSVQLCLLRFLGVPPDAIYDAMWLLLGFFLAVAGRLVAIDSITRPGVRLRRLLPVGLFEGATVLAGQIALFRAGHIWYQFSPLRITVLLALCSVAAVIALTTAARMVRAANAKPWQGARAVYVFASVLGVFALRYAATLVQSVKKMHRLNLPLHSDALELPGTIIGTIILFAALVLCCTHVTLLLHRRAIRSSRELRESEERREMMSALTEQRVVSLQNEALLEEIRERKKMEAQLAQSAFHDAVTGLRNRVYLGEEIRNALQKKHARMPLLGVLLYIDIDNFKSVNDMLGHLHGDRLLQQIAKRLQRCIPTSGTLARMGGDEFAALLGPAQNADCALRLAQHILSVLEEPCEVAGTTFNLSASIGVCPIDRAYMDAEAIVRDADLAMYRSKHRGGASAVMYEPFMHAEAVDAMHARAELKRGLQQEEFVLWYQPLVDMQDGSIYGMEALIRWMHPQKGLVGPGAFIKLAEDTGHIVEMGNWVLRRGCMDYAALQAQSATPLLLSLNVSTRQLELNNFMDLLKAVLAETKMPPNKLQLEITESILLGDPVGMGRVFREIRSLGVKIAFDDFGTGYSSLSYIQRFPVDTLKIDQSFVRSLKNGPVNADVIRLMIDLSVVTGMRVSAEGIESIEEASTMLRLGCRIAQGFLYSKPVPIDDFLKLLSRKSLAPPEMLNTHSAPAIDFGYAASR
jgi:diguanylate cyclase (GGDEF)-like protein